jgi:hypothetical protein
VGEKVTDLSVVRAERKESCLYCGKDAHAAPLACPRIAAIEVDPEIGAVCGISFWGDFFEEEPTSAA